MANFTQVFGVFGFLLWVYRVYCTKCQLDELKVPFTWSVLARALISRAIDNDDATYTVVSFTSFSFLFLGGLQLSYQNTLTAMLIVYFVASFGDTIRIILCVASANSLADVVQTSSIVQSQLRKVKTQLNPSNVYEDLGRGRTIVFMVFVTQCILIAFVVRARIGRLLKKITLKCLQSVKMSFRSSVLTQFSFRGCNGRS
jgi:hypothetical protein